MVSLPSTRAMLVAALLALLLASGLDSRAFLPDAAMLLLMRLPQLFAPVFPGADSFRLEYPRQREQVVMLRSASDAIIYAVDWIHEHLIADEAHVAFRRRQARQWDEAIRLASPDREVGLVVISPSGKQSLEDGERIVLAFHGGGTVTGYTPSQHEFILAQELNVTVVGVHYRKDPENPYPSAVHDCVGALQHLVRTYPNSRIGLAGVSAGGLLTAAVAREAIRLGLGSRIAFQALIVPMLSPLANTASFLADWANPIWSAQSNSWFWKMYVGGDDMRMLECVRDPVCAPLLAPADSFSGLPRAAVVTATADALRTEGQLYGRLLRAAKVQCESFEVRGSHMMGTLLDVHQMRPFWDTLRAYLANA